MNAALSLQQAMRSTLLAHVPLVTLLGGAHIFDELPRGEHPPLVAFTDIETRDWSVSGQKAHEHFITIEVTTNERSRAMAQKIAQEIETALDLANLSLVDHRLINLRNIFWSVSRRKSTDTFGATLRFRAATEPL
jgi:phenylpyruvate tautomerase PptA (4-oxalocrotonate tautomerase family)